MEPCRTYVEEMLGDDDEVILGVRNRSSKAIGREEFCRRVDAQHREVRCRWAGEYRVAGRRVFG